MSLPCASFFCAAPLRLHIAPSIIQDVEPYGTTSSRRPTKKFKRAGPSQRTLGESLRDSRDGPGATLREDAQREFRWNSRKSDRAFGEGWGRAAEGQRQNPHPSKTEECGTRKSDPSNSKTKRAGPSFLRLNPGNPSRRRSGLIPLEFTETSGGLAETGRLWDTS